MLLHHSLHLAVFKSIFQVSHGPIAFAEVDELGLDQGKNFADLALGSLGREFDLVTSLGGRPNIFGFVLSHILSHYLVVEANWVLVGLRVVQFVSFWLNDVALARRGCVVQAVFLGAGTLLSHQIFVLPSRFLLGNQTLCWRGMSLQVLVVGAVEVAQHRVKRLISRCGLLAGGTSLKIALV